MNTQDLAKLSGVSIRTLHYYDKIGLLIPQRNLENGYRNYEEKDLEKLQQILLLKGCGFSLEKIQKFLSSPAFDKEKAFLLQKNALIYEKNRIDAMLKTLEKSMQAMKGEITMTKKEMFQGFDFSKNPYEEEARQLWGDEAIDKSNAHITAMSPMNDLPKI